MVQKGKFSAGADCLVSTLKKVDFLQNFRNVPNYYPIKRTERIPYPTLGKPTIPHFREVPNRPNKGPGPSDSEAPLFLFGGIVLLHLTDTKSRRALRRCTSTSLPVSR